MPRYCEFTGSPGHPWDEVGLKRLCPHAGFEFCTLFGQPLTASPEGWRLCLVECDRPVYTTPDKPTTGAAMIRLTRQHILRIYKGRMHELTVTVSGHRRGWSIFMKPPAKNDDIPLATPFSKYSKYSHLVMLARHDQHIYQALLGNPEWMSAKDRGFSLPNMRSLTTRGFLEFKKPLPKVRKWEGNWREWEIDVMGIPFKLSEYGLLVVNAWSWFEWMWTPDTKPDTKITHPHKPRP